MLNCWNVSDLPARCLRYVRNIFSITPGNLCAVTPENTLPADGLIPREAAADAMSTHPDFAGDLRLRAESRCRPW